jgi:heme o synthase
MTALPDIAAEAPVRPWGETVRLYVDITRPKVMALVVFTAVPALALGQAGWPSLGHAVAVLTATALAGAASSALNAYIERDSDAKMARTRNRPLPASALMPDLVLAYGVVLTIVSTIMLWWVGGSLAAFVGLATIAFYVGVYTMWLKPRTPQNIVIGGAAGATAPLIASAAMDGSVSLGAWLLFAIIFLWTPPHFWAIAIYRRNDYERAGFPMMNLVVGDQATRYRSLAYAIAVVLVSLTPIYLGYLGAFYGVCAAVLGLWFVARVVQSIRDQHVATDRKVFMTSNIYLMTLFLSMIVDLV